MQQTRALTALSVHQLRSNNNMCRKLSTCSRWRCLHSRLSAASLRPPFPRLPQQPRTVAGAACCTT